MSARILKDLMAIYGTWKILITQGESYRFILNKVGCLFGRLVELVVMLEVQE